MANYKHKYIFPSCQGNFKNHCHTMKIHRVSLTVDMITNGRCDQTEDNDQAADHKPTREPRTSQQRNMSVKHQRPTVGQRNIAQVSHVHFDRVQL